MDKWNNTGKIKALLIAGIAFWNFFVNVRENTAMKIQFIFLPLIFGALMLFLMSRLNDHYTKVPDWNENPFRRSSSRLTFPQFAAWFFLSSGFGMTVGKVSRSLELSFNGMICFSFGLGILAGIWLILRFPGKKGS